MCCLERVIRPTGHGGYNMQKMTKKDIAKVLKEVANKNYMRVDLLINGYVVVYNEFDIIGTFYIYYSEKVERFSILYVNVISTSNLYVRKMHELVEDLEDTLNGKTQYDYPMQVVKAVEEWYKHNADGISETEVREMKPSTIASLYLEWEGIIGYNSTMEAIYNAKKR